METFGRYQLLSRIGYGGMAEVFVGRTDSLEGTPKVLAIKRLLPWCTEDDEVVELLADEARLVIRLSHPNIVQIFDFGRVNNQYYIAMEYVDGLDLKTLIGEGTTARPLPLPLALYVVATVLEALDYAHKRTDADGRPLGIIHRDVTPHNVLISRDGRVKLTDFGVARAATSSHVSVAGDIRGKFSYMPPEQACGGEIDHRVDVFAAGALLYEALTGRPPYASETNTQQMASLGKNLPPPSSVIKAVPPEVDRIVARAMSRAPNERYPTAVEFARAVRAQLDQHFGAMAVQDDLGHLVAARLAEPAAQQGETMLRAEFSPRNESLIARDMTTSVLEQAPTRQHDVALHPTPTLDPDKTLVDLGNADAAEEAATPPLGAAELAETMIEISSRPISSRSLTAASGELTQVRDARPITTEPTLPQQAVRGGAASSASAKSIGEDYTLPMIEAEHSRRDGTAFADTMPAPLVYQGDRLEHRVLDDEPDMDAPTPVVATVVDEMPPPIAVQARQQTPAPNRARTRQLKRWLQIAGIGLLVVALGALAGAWLATQRAKRTQTRRTVHPLVRQETTRVRVINTSAPIDAATGARDASPADQATEPRVAIDGAPLVDATAPQAADVGIGTSHAKSAAHRTSRHSTGTATLHITAPRGALIEIHKRRKRYRSPLKIDLPAGTHRLRIRVGARTSRWRAVHVKAGQVKELRFRLRTR
ncbi:MAG: serine/threonine protein kinase [Deltaproteobacteria bacterium]|nr:serine/threonine protein kinase [Deltaproteobacteria bacterium]